MKNIIFGLATILLIALVACNNNKEKRFKNDRYDGNES